MKQSVDKILEWVSYDPDTGNFRWKKTSGRGYAGEVAGAAHSKGYLYITIRGVPYLAHRLAWYVTHGSFPRQQIDHRNGEGTGSTKGQRRLPMALERDSPVAAGDVCGTEATCLERTEEN